MKKASLFILPILLAAVFLSGCAKPAPPSAEEINELLIGEWISWLGGEDNSALLYTFTESEVTMRHLCGNLLIEIRTGAYSVGEVNYDRGKWWGTVEMSFPNEVQSLPFRFDSENGRLALGVSKDINSPGFVRQNA